MSKATCAGFRLVAVLLCGTLLAPGFAARPFDGERSAPPSEAEQHRIIEAVRQYADEYIARLPNFTCKQTTLQFEAGRKPSHWRKGDTLTARLIFNRGREDRSLELVNDKPIRSAHRVWRTPLTTEGEFGILLSNVLDPASEAQFVWERWDQLGGERLAVFNYSISQQRSTLSLSLSDLAKATLAYHGSIFADPETGAVARITSETSDIPAEVRTRSIATTIDYADVEIAGRRYRLPSQAEVLLATNSTHVRNEILFTEYRKFEAESTITFSSVEAEDGNASAGRPKTVPQP